MVEVTTETLDRHDLLVGAYEAQETEIVASAGTPVGVNVLGSGNEGRVPEGIFEFWWRSDPSRSDQELPRLKLR